VLRACPALGIFDTKRRSKTMVQSGLHAFSWGLQRFGVVLAMTLGAAMMIIAIFVVVLVGIDAASSFGQ
jgi:hypothetical protein